MRLPWKLRRAGAAALGGILVPVLRGPNRGFRWSLATSGRGCVTGRWEPHRLDAINRFTREGDIFWDLGAHKGYVSLLASRRVGPEGQVYAIEPSWVNLAFLRRHVAANRLANVQIVAAAASGYDGEASFGGNNSSVAYRLGRGSETVKVRTVDSLVRELGLLPPTVLKIDVEGEEAAVLRGAAGQLGPHAIAIISLHSLECYTACSELLAERGFTVHESPAVRENAARGPAAWRGDPDILAVGPARTAPEAGVRAFTGAG